jgi:cytochrome c-type biogenesis protein CcmH
MEQQPDDVEGWTMLGRSYQVLGRYPDAAKAFARAAARSPEDPHLLADLADALAMAAGQSMQGEPERLVQRALQIDPNNLKALALAGTAAFERADYAGAATLWERMLPHVPPASEDAQMIQANVAEARSRIQEKSGAAAGLKGTVQLSPTLASRASPEDTVFIFARAAQGPALPLAVLRRKVRDLPLEFSLDDSMAMTPAAKLSAHPTVVVGARVSKTGNATPQPGDLQGLSAPVPNTAQGVAVTIDAEVPK